MATIDPDGTLWYLHNPLSNAADLINQAEMIKAATSALLHQNAELKGLKVQIYPYEMQKIQLPQWSARP